MLRWDRHVTTRKRGLFLSRAQSVSGTVDVSVRLCRPRARVSRARLLTTGTRCQSCDRERLRHQWGSAAFRCRLWAGTAAIDDEPSVIAKADATERRRVASRRPLGRSITEAASSLRLSIADLALSTFSRSSFPPLVVDTRWGHVAVVQRLGFRSEHPRVGDALTGVVWKSVHVGERVFALVFSSLLCACSMCVAPIFLVQESPVCPCGEVRCSFSLHCNVESTDNTEDEGAS